jgi:thioredoxin
MSTFMISTDDQGFEAAVLRAPEPALVDFWAPWCPPCRVIAPILEDLAREYQGRLRVVKVNADDNPGVVSRYEVLGMPTLLFFAGGREVHRLVGAWPRARLVDAIEQVLAGAGAAAPR